jgi:soluble lytic murein transglycosylase
MIISRMNVLSAKNYFLLICFLIFCSPITGGAEIFRYVDKDGVVHFTNTPVATAGKPLNYKPYLEEIGSTDSTYFNIEKINEYIIQASTHYNLSCNLIKAIIKVESNFNCDAISKKGAIGLMQIMPQNFNLLSINDPFDPLQNIMGGARYLKNMLQRYNGDILLSLAAYNAGPSAVDRYGSIPPYSETQRYVQKVIDYYRLYENEG